MIDGYTLKDAENDYLRSKYAKAKSLCGEVVFFLTMHPGYISRKDRKEIIDKLNEYRYGKK